MAEPDARALAQTGLRRWLREEGIRARVELDGRASIGLSQETWFLRMEMDGERNDAVLRLPTPSSGARAIRNQRAALALAGTAVPAPALIWHDDGEHNPFGRPFIVMTRLAGEVPVQWSQMRQGRRERLAREAIDLLSSLHGLDPAPLREDAGTRDLHSPRTALDFYTRRLEALGALPPVLSMALWWLRRHLPGSPARSTVVHGDYRMGNFVIDGDRIAGVLDWEMCGVGDPLADLAWCFIPVWNLPGVLERELESRYFERCEIEADMERLRWHRVLGYVRLAYYALSGIGAFQQGRSDDLRLAALRLQLPVHLDRLAATLAGAEVL